MGEKITDCQTCARELLEFLVRLTNIAGKANRAEWKEAKEDLDAARGSLRRMEEVQCITEPIANLVRGYLERIERAIEEERFPSSALIAIDYGNSITRAVVGNIRARFIEQCVR
jgi:hypothetical protein